MKKQFLPFVLLLTFSTQAMWAQQENTLKVDKSAIIESASDVVPESEKCWNIYTHEIDVWSLQTQDNPATVNTKLIPRSYEVISKIINAPEDPNCVYFVTKNKQLLEAHYINSSWKAHKISGDLVVSPNFNISQTGQEIFLSTEDRSLVQLMRKADYNWSQKHFLADFENRNGGMIKVDNIKSDIQVADNPRKIFYIADDHKVWNLFYLDGRWRANALNCEIDNAEHDLVLNDPTGLSVSYITKEETIAGLHWNKCENPNPTCVESYEIASEQKKLEVKKHENIDPALAIYPNPVSDILYIESSPKHTIGDVYIYTVQGQLIQKVSAQKNQSSVDVSKLAPGAYIIKTDTESAIITKYMDN